MKTEVIHAAFSDLERIVEIYNASIPSGMATADTEPVSVESRFNWFEAFNQTSRPILLLKADGVVVGWCGFRDFYGRPAYQNTTEVAVYIDPMHARKGFASMLLDVGLKNVHYHGVENILAFVFSHNVPSLNLFEKHGFVRKGELDAVADLNGIKRSLTLLQRRLIHP